VPTHGVVPQRPNPDRSPNDENLLHAAYFGICVDVAPRANELLRSWVADKAYAKVDEMSADSSSG
jgi:hypothetical protein